MRNSFLSCIVCGMVILTTSHVYGSNFEFIDAARNGELAQVERLLPSTSINTITGANETALSAAVEAGHIAVVKYLLENEANQNIMRNNRTALMWAAEHGNYDMVNLLLQYAPSHVVDRRGDNNRTAADFAHGAGHQDIADLINNYESLPGHLKQAKNK